MMDWSDRHCRYFWRGLTGGALLYTEMVPAGALLYGERGRFLRRSPEENPVALQLGGSSPAELARCAAWAQEWGFDEVNLNCGCPSTRVRSGRFGACLMAEPARVAECVAAMGAACDLPVTVKHRTGLGDAASFETMAAFVETVAKAGCRVFIAHARAALLDELSPKQNRAVPPLQYPWVYRLKQAFPQLEIIINGGISSLDECEAHLRHVDGVMLGRAAYQNPYLLAEVDRRILGRDAPPPSREEAALGLLPYIERALAEEEGARLSHITRHILGLYQGVPGARKFRRHLSERAGKPGAGGEVLREAVQLAEDALREVETNAPVIPAAISS